MKNDVFILFTSLKNDLHSIYNAEIVSSNYIFFVLLNVLAQISHSTSLVKKPFFSCDKQGIFYKQCLVFDKKGTIFYFALNSRYNTPFYQLISRIQFAITEQKILRLL